MKKICLVLILSLVLFLVSCTYEAYLIGEEDVIVELGDEYNDSGIHIPSSFRYEEENNIDINKCGVYHYTYKIYNNQDKLVNKVSRKVIVKDTTAPRYVLKNIDKLCAFIKYDVNYFFDSVSDNSTYAFYPKSIIFYDEGWHNVSFSIIDKYNNKTTINRVYNISKDKDLLEEILVKENRIIRYDNGDIKAFFGQTRLNDYFHFYKEGNTYIYKINEIEENISIEYIYSIIVSSEGLKEHSRIIINDLCFEFESYEFKDEYILNQTGYSNDISNIVENAYKLLDLYIDLFSTK